MTVRCLVLGLRARRLHLTLVAAGERVRLRKELLSVICVDLIAIKLWVLRYDFRLNRFTIILIIDINLLGYFSNRTRCQIPSHLRQSFLITRAKYEKRVNNRVLCLDPVDETRSCITILGIRAPRVPHLRLPAVLLLATGG